MLDSGGSPHLTFPFSGCLSIRAQQRPLCSELTYVTSIIGAQRGERPILFEEKGVFFGPLVAPFTAQC